MKLPALLLLLALAACKPDQVATAPSPVEPGADAVGHYCGMSLDEHTGPKGQIHLASRKDPIWVSSVRDVFAFTHLPEEPKDVAAIYVNDMAKAHDWHRPEPGAWVEARQAWYVLGSDQRGGMDAREAVPFSIEAVARTFAAEHGGKVLRFQDIGADFALSGDMADLPKAEPAPAPAHSGHGKH